MKGLSVCLQRALMPISASSVEVKIPAVMRERYGRKETF